MKFYSDIAQECKELKIGLVIANAGIYRPGKFIDTLAELHQDMLDANIYHVVGLIHSILP